ncbi:MAG: Gfo/Idh/MocA family oxidoreductase [Fuerstiella sp.]|nr:Gfo/Idh/MocA family oxidoreductase [Fuerstiella sp.]
MRPMFLLLVWMHASVFLTCTEATVLRIGMIGLDTSHSVAFTRLINTSDDETLAEVRVVAAYPHGSSDIQSSVSRIPKFTAEMRALGIEIIQDLPSMIDQVDAVLLETNDGRPHLEQLVPVLRAGKPCFIDKPLAGSLTDCLAIFDLAKHYNVPVFSSSSLRYTRKTQAARHGSLGKITGCSTWSPCTLEKTHPDLFWYGIHGVESLFTVMGTGISTVTRVQTDDCELVTGVWNDGRIGTFRGLRSGKRGYGGVAFGTTNTGSIGSYDGYEGLVVEIAKFFRSGEVPIDPGETIEIYAFMEAADESKRQGFVPVSVCSVIDQAMVEAAARVQALTAEP